MRQSRPVQGGGSGQLCLNMRQTRNFWVRAVEHQAVVVFAPPPDVSSVMHFMLEAACFHRSFLSFRGKTSEVYFYIFCLALNFPIDLII